MFYFLYQMLPKRTRSVVDAISLSYNLFLTFDLATVSDYEGTICLEREQRWRPLPEVAKGGRMDDGHTFYTCSINIVHCFVLSYYQFTTTIVLKKEETPACFKWKRWIVNSIPSSLNGEHRGRPLPHLAKRITIDGGETFFWCFMMLPYILI